MEHLLVQYRGAAAKPLCVSGVGSGSGGREGRRCGVPLPGAARLGSRRARRAPAGPGAAASAAPSRGRVLGDGAAAGRGSAVTAVRRPVCVSVPPSLPGPAARREAAFPPRRPAGGPGAGGRCWSPAGRWAAGEEAAVNQRAGAFILTGQRRAPRSEESE